MAQEESLSHQVLEHEAGSDVSRDLSDLDYRTPVDFSLAQLTESETAKKYAELQGLEMFSVLTDNLIATNQLSERRLTEYKFRVDHIALWLTLMMDEDNHEGHIGIETMATHARNVIDSTKNGFRAKTATEQRSYRVYKQEQDQPERRGLFSW